MLTWVPMQPVADALADLAGVSVEVLTPDVVSLPASAAEVEFYVPPFFPAPAVAGGYGPDADPAGGADADCGLRPGAAARPAPVPCCATRAACTTPARPSGW